MLAIISHRSRTLSCLYRSNGDKKYSINHILTVTSIKDERVGTRVTRHHIVASASFKGVAKVDIMALGHQEYLTEQ